MTEYTQKVSPSPSAKRLLQAAKSYGDTKKKDVADRLNTSPQTITNWIARGVSQDGALAAQKAYGCDANWVLFGESKTGLDADYTWSNIVGMNAAAALGDGCVADEYATTHQLKFRSESLRRKHLQADKLAILYGRGDSMSPTIEDGDAIMFDRSDTEPRDGKIYVITYEGMLYAKRLMELDGAWYARSDNDSDPKWRKPRRLDPSRGLEIAGRVRWVAGWVD